MKIKNILALGLITVVSGISTAQTYNATAGTSGVADIQSDYSMATGDGASVSVDVPLEFELPKKVAIAMKEGGNLPANSMFDGVTHVYDYFQSTGIIDLTPHNTTTWTNLSKNGLGVTGAIYANTAINVVAEITDFIHESDPNSSFKSCTTFRIGKKENGNAEFTYTHDDNDSSTTRFPHSANLDESSLATTDNQLSFSLISWGYLDTIDTTDRAGKYTQIATFTVTTL